MPEERFTDPERRREVDDFSWRLGRVETQSDRNGEDLRKLERLVGEFIAAMPAQYVQRHDFEKLIQEMQKLTVNLETFIATANASNAMREKAELDRERWQHEREESDLELRRERHSLRLSWPQWMFAAVLIALTVAGWFVHHT